MTPPPTTNRAEQDGEEQDRTEPFRWRSRRGLAMVGWLAGALAVAGIIIFGLVRAESETTYDSAATTVSIPIQGVWVPRNTTIGVVVTNGSGVTEGAQWAEAAEGIVVAAERLRLGGTDVQLLVRDDHGTAKGAQQAVEQLLENSVTGIIYASEGPHLHTALNTTAEAGVPVILPYAQPPPAEEDLGEENLAIENVWSLAPVETDLGHTLTQLISAAQRPLHIHAGESLPAGITVAEQLEYTVEVGSTAIARHVAQQAGLEPSDPADVDPADADPVDDGAYSGNDDGEAGAPVVTNPVDLVVISGHPVHQGQLVYALQSANVTVPILLTGSADSPLFATTLAELGGTVSSHLSTVGIETGDATAFYKTPQGSGASAYLTALRQFAGDATVENLTSDAPFADVAGAADARSHDAFMALAQAISTAGSNNPKRVSAALSELVLPAGGIISGPTLDFSRSTATTGTVNTGTVRVLHATGQRLGLRPVNSNHPLSLVWFARQEATDAVAD